MWPQAAKHSSESQVLQHKSRKLPASNPRSALLPTASYKYRLSAVFCCRYGLYYGILSRDSAEVASDRIASSMGTGRKMAVSVRDCGICGGELQVWWSGEGGGGGWGWGY